MALNYIRMLIPLRTDRDFRRRPVVTETLIVVNLLVYLVMTAGAYLQWFDVGQFIATGGFRPVDFSVWQLLTYQFLHSPAGPWHIAFNMLFLWIFGGAVEDRMKRLSFLMFYLMAGVIAGLAHMMVTQSPHSPLIGASGSIAGVTGAFLALFPRSTIKVLVFFFIVGIFHIRSLWFIGFFFAMDVLRQTRDLFGDGGSNVAYMAHIAGYIFGFLLAFALLAMHIIKHEDTDVFFLFKQSRRRAAFRAASKGQAAGMWESASADTAKRIEKQKKSRPFTAEQQRQSEQRAEINRLLADHDLPTAASLYRELLSDHKDAVLAEQRQLDIANQLYAEGDHKTAARAYELFLDSYPGSGNVHEVRLILGIIYTRRLSEPQRARELLEQARTRLSEQQAELARQLLAELGPA